MERTSKAETAIGDLNAEVEQLMMTMSQVVHGTAPAATGGGRRGGRVEGREAHRSRHRTARAWSGAEHRRTASVLFGEARAILYDSNTEKNPASSMGDVWRALTVSLWPIVKTLSTSVVKPLA